MLTECFLRKGVPFREELRKRLSLDFSQYATILVTVNSVMFAGLAQVLLIIYVHELCLRGIYLCDLKMVVNFAK